MKPENQLQHNIVMWFSQTFPEYYGCLWAVFNENSKHKKALGMHSGASDLQLFINDRFGGIEVKAKGSIHKTNHIKRQIEWGKNIIKNGGYYIISSDFEEITDFIFLFINNKPSMNNSIDKVEEQFCNKTVKF